MRSLDYLPLSIIKHKFDGFDIITFDDIKNELEKKNDDRPVYYVNVKENDDLAIIYYNDLPDNNTDRDIVAKEFELNCRSIIIEKSTLLPIASQFNKIIYNNDAIEYLRDIDWDNVIIQPCYEGTSLLLYHHNDKWYVSTRRCLDSNDSVWVKDKSYGTLFNEAIEGKFCLDDLSRDYCYHFILVHYRDRNIVSYSGLGDEYKELFHILTTEKYTLNEVDYKINGARYINTVNFKNIYDLQSELVRISRNDETNFTISTEGYVAKVYEGEKYKSPFKTLKFQTSIYQSIMKIKPNNSNIHQSYLELYQKNKLNEFLLYYSKFNNDISNRINMAMKNITKEILDLYHLTRQKKNPHIYEILREQYKKVLYKLHGMYINFKKQELDKRESRKRNRYNIYDDDMPRSINVHDVYHYIKSLPPQELRQLFFERTLLLENPMAVFLNKSCIYTRTQSVLMFDK